MKGFVAVAAVLAVMSMASANMITTTKDAITTNVAASDPPICKFDPVKGEYICPGAPHVAITAKPTNGITKGAAAVVAADCHKCQHDWDECMKKWGCWFYDCNNACKCQVVKNDPSCQDCSAGKCHA